MDVCIVMYIPTYCIEDTEIGVMENIEALWSIVQKGINKKVSNRIEPIELAGTDSSIQTSRTRF